MSIIWLIIIVLVILWLLGFLGPGRRYFHGGWIHTLIVIALILLVLHLLGVL